MKHTTIGFILLLGALLAGCSSPGKGTEGSGAKIAAYTGETRRETAAGLSYAVPVAWETDTPSSGMRAAQYKLPSSSSGEETPELVVYFFGVGQGGETEANIARWIGQMEQADGKPAAEQATRAATKIGDFRVTTVRVNGTYMGSAAGMPGMGQSQSHP
jgi:hypothetical protein